MSLRSRFEFLWRRAVGGADPACAWSRLDAGYGGADRIHHGWPHIGSMLADLDLAKADEAFHAVAFDEVELAIFFHDAVYDPRRSDNEAESARLMSEVVGDATALGRNGVERVRQLILATTRHEPSPDIATMLLLDIDLAVLGSDPMTYAAYASAIRREYRHVPEALWRTGRRSVLDRFLARRRLFQTDAFGDRLEAVARANIVAERESLARG